MGSILLVCLLLAFLGKDTHPFSASHHQYTLDFKKWCQKNDKYTTERPVRRRPAEFVSKQNMAEIAAQRWLYNNVVMFESTRWGGGGRGVYFKKQNFKGMTKRLLLRGDYSTVLWCLKAKCGEGGILLKSKTLKIWMIEIIAQRWLLYNVMMFESTVLGKGILLKSKT